MLLNKNIVCFVPKYSLFCTEIGKKIAEILLVPGDYAIGEFGSLKDKLNAVRKDPNS
jgi:hypothetical protein